MAKKTSSPISGQATSGAANTGHTNNRPVIVRDRGREILEEYDYNPEEIDAAPLSKKYEIDPDSTFYRPDTVH